MMNNKLTIGGYIVSIEARLVRTGIFSGIIHVHARADGQPCEPPVVVIIPGQWKSEKDARKAAADYAAVMAADGAVEGAIAVRDLALA